MLDEGLKTQLASYLERVTQPFALVASLDDSETSQEMRVLLRTIQSLCPAYITLREDGTDVRRPSFALERTASAAQPLHLRFAGLPLGHEFTSLVLALLWTGGHPPKVEADVLEQMRALSGEMRFEVYMSLSCHNCPDVVQALALLAVCNPQVHTTIIEGGAFQDEIAERQVMGVPVVFLNGTQWASGHMTAQEILHKLDSGLAARAAAQLSGRAAYDVLVLGGGPAGAAAAVYAARKGIRVGLLAERLGGQVNDTLDIENYIAMPHTQGPQLAAALEQHVRAYEVDVMTLQRTKALRPAVAPHAVHEVELESGAVLRAKSVVIATGARWRNMNVPGEETYRTRGVAYCPHCDGPLYKGKRVAVIGGGNSGVEAAIDLAGVVEHVTVFEFMPELKADAVLQRKLASLSNVEVLVNVQTTEVLGDGSKVTGLAYVERASGQARELALQGVFVQIGLLPNTDWLQGTLALSPHGEIVVDAKGQTSVPGIFAAGDCTTVPYKQIVIAAGAGATAALGAFDYLIRAND